MEYDGEWTLSLPPGAAGPPPDSAAPLLSNGTVGVVPRVNAGSGFDTSRSVVCGPAPWSSDALDAFHFLRLRLYSPELHDVEHHLASTEDLPLSLDMGTGTFTAPYVVARASDGALLCSAIHDVRALRHLPHFVLHTVALTVPQRF